MGAPLLDSCKGHPAASEHLAGPDAQAEMRAIFVAGTTH